MYKIIGTDQKEYGPVTSDKINQWILQGRVNAQTRAQTEGGEWKPLGDFPEFAAAFGHLPPVPPAVAPSPLSSPPPPAGKTSGLAIASLVFGILGFFSCGVLGIVGLILGIIAMTRVKKSGGEQTGFGLALAGTIISAVFMLMLPLALAMLLPALAAAKQKAQTIQCMNNMRQLTLSVKVYSGDHSGHFPPAATWCDSIKNLGNLANSEQVFKCPAANSNDRCDYAYNAKLDGLDEKNINGNTVLLFESEDGWNASGGQELMLSRARHRSHGGVFVVAFADGHVESVPAEQLTSLRWNP